MSMSYFYKRKFGSFGGSNRNDNSRFSEKNFSEDHPYVLKPTKSRLPIYEYTWQDIFVKDLKSWKHQTKSRKQWEEKVKKKEKRQKKYQLK